MGSEKRPQLQTDDGTPLTIKEGVIVDDEGRPTHEHSGFKVVSVGKYPWSIGLLGLASLAIFVPIIVTVVLAFLALGALFLMSIFIFRVMFRGK